MRFVRFFITCLYLAPALAIGQLKPAGAEYDVNHYKIEQEVDPDTLYIRGMVQFTFLNKKVPFSQFSCHLSNQLRVDSVHYHEKKVLFNHQSDVVAVNLPAPLTSAQLDSIKIYYQGVPGGTGGFSSFSKSAHSGGNAIYTLSQPFGASDWWPCKNTLDDKADSLDIFLKVPQGHLAVSNGLLLDSVRQGNAMVFHWKHRHPIATYLVAIAVSKYVHYTDSFLLRSGKWVCQENYIYPASISKARAETPKLAKSIQLFSELFGDYPFYDEKYGHAQFGWGGGMEHQTISFVGNFSHDLLVHELAHQWFGDLITCGSWIDLWLNEGFATYLTGVSKEKTDTDQTAFTEWKARTIDAIMARPDGSIYNSDSLNINRLFDNRLTYNKAAMMLHMLRRSIGDTAFFSACRYYLDAHRHGFVRTSSLISELEKACSRDLTYYFSQWLYGEGYPKYDISWMHESDRFVRITVQQRTSVNVVPFFKLPLPLRFYKGQAYFDTLLMNDFSGQVYRVSLPWVPDSMAFNVAYDLVAEGQVSYLGKTFASSGSMILYPNNGQRQVNFETRNGLTVKEVSVYATDGKCIYEESSAQPLEAGRFDFSGWPSGLYLIRFRFIGGGQETLKLMLQ